MSLTYNVATLRSRTKNATITAARTAAKAIGGLLGKLKQWAGYAFTAVTKFFNLSFSNLWDMFVSAYFAIKYFDFGATDKDLEKQIETNNQRLVTIAAEALGETLGFGTVRLANAFVGRFTNNKSRTVAQSMKLPVLSAEIGLALAEEYNDELQQNVKRFLNSTISAQISNAFINTVLTARRNHWFGLNSITTAQTNGSIQQKIEQKIQQLPKFWQQPVEEFIEGFEEGIIEAGYIVSYKIDDHIAAARYAKNHAGVERKIEVVPEKGSDEKLLIQGNQSDVLDVLDETLQSTFPLIRNRDIGEVFSEPIDETVKPKKQMRKVVINFNEYPKPPYYRKGAPGKRSSISIPDAKPGLKWQELRSTVDGYTAGDTFVSCELDSGRSMAGYFISKSQGEKVLTKLATLSTSDIIPDSFRASEGKKTAATGASKQMHVQSASLLYPKRKGLKDTGIKGKPVKVSLWNDTEPANFKPFV